MPDQTVVLAKAKVKVVVAVRTATRRAMRPHFWLHLLHHYHL